MTLINHFIELFIVSAPWLLLGLLIAGLIKVYVPTDMLIRHLGGRDFATTFKAALIGAPLPLCSCGVIPATLGLRRSGASPNATVSFLVATPETGVDSVAVSYALLGPVMAITRPLAAILSALAAGEMVRRFGRGGVMPASTSESPDGNGCCASGQSCCGSTAPVAHTPQHAHASSCCSGDASLHRPRSPRWRQAIEYAVDEMLPDTAWWLLLGLFFAALVQAYVPPHWLAQWGDGLLAMAAMVLISIPMYICATASTPIAVGLLAAGLSPGAVLVFLLAGPATNMATLGMVGREMGRATLLAYLVGVIGGAILTGLALNALLTLSGWQVTPASLADAGETLNWIMWASGAVLAGLIIRLGWRQWRRPQPGSCCGDH